MLPSGLSVRSRSRALAKRTPTTTAAAAAASFQNGRRVGLVFASGPRHRRRRRQQPRPRNAGAAGAAGAAAAAACGGAPAVTLKACVSARAHVNTERTDGRTDDDAEQCAAAIAAGAAAAVEHDGMRVLVCARSHVRSRARAGWGYADGREAMDGNIERTTPHAAQREKPK